MAHNDEALYVLTKAGERELVDVANKGENLPLRRNEYKIYDYSKFSHDEAVMNMVLAVLSYAPCNVEEIIFGVNEIIDNGGPDGEIIVPFFNPVSDDMIVSAIRKLERKKYVQNISDLALYEEDGRLRTTLPYDW